MSQFKLKSNQAALIISVSLEGEIEVGAAFPEEIDASGELASLICTVIDQKLSEDEEFQREVIG